MMKKVTFGICLLASAVLAATVADAQQSGAGAAGGTGAAAQTGQQGQQGLPGTQPGGIGAGQDQGIQPGATREQAGQLLQPQEPGIQTRQNVVTPENRFGQQRGFNFQGGIPDPAPTPAEMQAQGLQPGTTASGQRGEPGMAAEGQRGELGVWLVASGGPGVEIRRITGGSAAELAGLQAGDIILEINGQGVMSPMEVQRMIRAIPAGQTATLEVWRDGTQQDVSATLQPVRESYQTAYRGDERVPANGDLAARTMRLEEQINMVMRELQQLRAEMARLHPETSGQPAGAGIGIEQPQPGQLEPSTTQPQPFEPEQPATEPAPTQPDQPATEPAATEPAEDLFGEEPAQPEAEATPPEETETETETDTDSLFQ